MFDFRSSESCRVKVLNDFYNLKIVFFRQKPVIETRDFFTPLKICKTCFQNFSFLLLLLQECERHLLKVTPNSKQITLTTMKEEIRN